MADPISLGGMVLGGAGLVTNLIGAGAQSRGARIAADGQLAAGDSAALAGRLQREAAEFEAKQIEQNAALERASGQRLAMEKRLAKTFAIGTAQTRAAASGVNAGTGSALQNEIELEQRGEYQALMDLFNGESAATGLTNKAIAVRHQGDLAEWEGRERKRLSRIQAAATIASGQAAMIGQVGSTLSQAGRLMFPTSRGLGGMS